MPKSWNVRPRITRALRRPIAVLAVLALALGTALAIAPAASAADPTASMSIQKAASVTTAVPGQTFEYTISFQCTAGTVNGCVNAQLTDPLPDYISLNGTPTLVGNTAPPVVDPGPPVAVVFQDDLGGGQIGLAPGNVITITIPVIVDPDIPVEQSGQPLTNTATITADNADPKSDDAVITPDVPTNLDASTTKSIDPEGGPAIPGTPLTVALGGTNTSNVPVDQLVIQDPADPTATPSPFLYLGVTGLGAVSMPAGAETVQVSVYVGGAWVDGPVGPPPPALPAGVDPADITGVRWTFASTDGANIPPGATAGAGLDLAQRDNVAELTDPITISDDATTTVTAGGESATSPPASDTYRIPPTAIDVAAGKSFSPDVVTAGDSSVVTITGTNNSEVPLESMTIVEPAPGTTSPFENGLTFDGIGSDNAGAGIVWPTGATAAQITYTGPGCPGTAQSTTTPNTLPGPPPGCTVTGFSVTFTGEIVPGASATIPFGVTTDPDQPVEELTRDNTVEVTGEANGVDGSDTATDSITSIVERLDVNNGKTLIPGGPLPSWPGEIVTASLSGQVAPFPESTTNATQIIVQDPATIPDPNQWYDSFDPQSVVATPVPGCSTLTVQYTVDGTTWLDVPGMTDIGPGIFNGIFPDDVSQNAIGIRFVYTADPAGGGCTGGFPPGTSVAPNLSFSLESDMNGFEGTLTDCSAASAANGEQSAQSDPACDSIDFFPPDAGAVDPIDKAWDVDLLNARSQAEAGATISWSTDGFTGIGRLQIYDTDGFDQPLPTSVFDSFDLLRIDPITPALDPLLTYDEITSVWLFQLPPGSTDPAAGAWVRASGDPCPAACDGTFPGYTLTDAERASTVAFRLEYEESPTRVDRLGAPGAPPVGSGVAASTGNNRKIHPVFQLRDDLRSNPDIPVTAARDYNVAGSPGLIDNTVRLDPFRRAIDRDPIQSFRDDDTIQLVDVPVTAQTTKDWAGGPLGIPEAGVPQDQYPTARVTITGSNTTPIKVDSLTMADPGGGPSPFDAFNLAGFVSITAPGDIGADDVTITLTRAGGDTAYTRDEALALAEADLVDVVGVVVQYTGRINAASATVVPTAAIVFDTRLRTASRSTGEPPQSGDHIDNSVTTTVSDLVDYPGVDPNTATDNAVAGIDLVAQGLAVDAGKSFSPASLTEPANGPVTVTLTGQPSGASRTVQMVLTDDAPTFWNAYDLIALNPATFTVPIDQVQVDALTGGTWSVLGGAPVLSGATWQLGAPTTGTAVALPSGVTPDQVQGLRFTFTRVDGANWENPANPVQPATFQVQRRDTLNTGGPVLPDLAQNPPSPGESAPGVATNSVDADATSSDVDANGNPLTASDDADAPITYVHSANEVTVSKAPNGQPEPPGAPFTYTLTITNSGDTDIVNPVVTDRFPTDADGPQVVLADPPGYTYTISGGTGMPTDPAEVTVAQTDSQLVFTFPDGSTLPVGATYTIAFRVTLRPGLPAGTQFTNEFGVVADRPWDTCVNGGSNAVDPDTGECSAPATNTVITAGAIGVSKTVKAEGSDTLGVLLDPADPVTQLCLADADGFYARPCVPIAQPGGDITWRINFTNTGNLPIDRVLGIDRLPEPGDAVGIAPALPRGSQWEPLLTGTRPAISDPTTQLNVYYTTATSGWCDGPTATDGALLCPALNWQAWADGAALPVDPATVTGLQFELLPADALAPAATVSVDLPMVAPPYSPADTPNTTGFSQDATYAFNSVGVTGRYVDGGTTGYTLATEPPRVGVALAHGAIQLLKLTEGEAAAQYAPDSFPVAVSCTSVGVDVPLGAAASQTLTADNPVTLYDLPYGATCTLTEGDNGQTSSSVQTAVVGHNTTDIQTVTLTNVYEFAGLAITKDVDSAAVDQNGDPVVYGPFEIAVDCTYLGEPVYAAGYGPDNPMTASLGAGQTATFTELPAGADCTITETDDKGAQSTTITTIVGESRAVTDGTEAPIELAPGDENGAIVTNEFPVGSLRIVKQVTGPLAQAYGAGPFTIAMVCVLVDDTGARPVWAGEIVLGGGAPLEAVVDNLPLGAGCVVTEPGNGGASEVTIDPQRIVVDDPETPVTVTVANDFRAGALQIAKQIDGPGAALAPGPFVFDVVCAFNGNPAAFTQTATLARSGQDAVLTSGVIGPIPVGALCTVTEVDSGGADSTPPPVTVTIPDVDSTGAAQVVIAGFVNPYSAAQLQIAKVLTGTGAANHRDDVFAVAVTCQRDLAGIRVTVYSGTVAVRGGQTAPVANAGGSPALLPVGARCWAAETDAGGAAATTVDHDSYDNAVAVVAGPSVATLTITVTNRFDDPGGLADTGAPVQRQLLTVALLLTLGAGLVLGVRRRRS